MTRRNHDRYTADDWREAGPTVGTILANRWLVYIGCDLWALSSPRKPCHPRASGDASPANAARASSCGAAPRRAAGWAARAGSPSGCGRMGRAGMWRWR